MISEEQVLAAARELGFRTPDSFARIRAALEAAERAAWRPIEEAPKDGTKFLGACDDMVVITWFGKTSHVPLYGWCWSNGGPEDVDLWEPDVFRPLPAPGEQG